MQAKQASSNRTITQLIQKRISYASNDAHLGIPGACDRVSWWREILDRWERRESAKD